MNAIRIISTPVGPVKLVASENGLKAVLWRNDSITNSHSGHAVLDETERQLQEYFSGHRKTFSVALDAQGTEFQKKVWQALLTIPFGETRSYQDIARQIGSPKASRAVGAANGKNPISILVPCHRVIGRNGTLTGFAGGLDVKQKLLEHEKGAH